MKPSQKKKHSYFRRNGLTIVFLALFRDPFPGELGHAPLWKLAESQRRQMGLRAAYHS